MYVVCDTNIFIHLFQNDEVTTASLSTIGSENILMPSITFMELCRGMRSQRELNTMLEKMNNYSILDIDAKASALARNLIQHYHLSHGLQIPDALIAASAIANNLRLFTYNIKDFRFIKNLALYHP